MTVSFAVGLVMMFIVPVRAYIDPSVMTYAIQAVAGIIISASMFAGIYWRRIRSFFKLGRTEQKNNILKDDLSFHDPAAGTDRHSLDFMPEDTKTRLMEEAREQQRTAQKDRSLRTAVLLAITISYLWMFYAPLQLHFSNINEFRFDIYAILPTLCLMFAVGLAAAMLVYSILYKCSRKLFNAVIVFSVIVLAGTYIQGTFMVKNLQVLDGSELIWSGHMWDHIQSLVLWSALFAGFIFLHRRYGNKQFMTIASAISSLLLCALIITNLSSGISNGGFREKQLPVVTADGQYTMSADRNFVVFIIDAADGETFRTLLETTDPEYKEVLADFTFFPNTVGAYTYTEQAIPQILTGRWYEFQKPFEEFVEETMEESALFRRLKEQDYRIGLYEEGLSLSRKSIEEYENVAEGKYRLDNFAEYARSSFCLMWYMYAPFAMKKVFANPGLYTTIRNQARADGNAFMGDNGAFYRALCSAEVTIAEEKCFRFMHIDGAHVPFIWDRNVNRISMDEGSYEQNYQAYMTIVQLYLEKLKSADVYDNTAIIIMADHGYDLEGNGNTGRENPLFLIKGMNESHEFRVSEQPVSYEDLMDIYTGLLDGKSAEELIGYSENDYRDRRIIVFDLTHSEDFYEYYQTGYASDESTMIPTGRVYNKEAPGED